MASKHVITIETNVVKTASFLLINNVFKNKCSNKNIWTCQHKAATAFISYMVLQTARLTSLHLKTGVTWLLLCYSVWEYLCTAQSTISFHITITNALVYWHISNQNQVHTCKFSRIKARKTNLFKHRLKITNLALFCYSQYLFLCTEWRGIGQMGQSYLYETNSDWVSVIVHCKLMHAVCSKFP